MYKLINKTIGEEHLCDKVTIDGLILVSLQ